MALGRTHIPVVDHARCQSCGVCLRQCPAEFSPGFRTDPATIRGYVYTYTGLPRAQQLPPCTAACPLGQDVREYVGLVHEGRYLQALLVVFRDNPLPGVLGAVCHRPCERACLKGAWNRAVAIRELKRFLAQWAATRHEEVVEALSKRKSPPAGRRVGIVGAGPAGLGCAYELLMGGCEVVVHDRLEKPGGMLRVGIPGFRLPQELLEGDIRVLEGLGMEFRGGVSLGEELDLEHLREEFDAVVLALGTWRDRRLGVEGEGARGCMGCLEFLKAVRGGQINQVDVPVAVVGGGNAAVDAARTALRLGAGEVAILYRRRREDMPADPEEVAQAEKEGVKILELVVPQGVVEERGGVEGIKLVRARAGAVDATGRPRPEPVAGSEFVHKAKMVVVAVGQEVEGPVPEEPEGGVFMAGDMVSGPSTVAQAVASGRAVAREVLEWLGS